MAVSGSGNLSPQEVARRAESWHGARVVVDKHKIKIFPKDPAHKPVFLPDRFSNGTDRSNALTWLRKAGIDVMTEPPKPAPAAADREEPAVSVPNPTVLAKTSVNGTKPEAAAPSSSDYETVLAMLAEAEQRDKDRRVEIADLAKTVDELFARVQSLDLQTQQNRAAMARMHKTVKDAERRWEAGGSLPVDEARRAEQERAEITDRAIKLLESLPPAATMAAGSIAASLGMPEKGNLLGKLMATAAKEERLTVLKVGTQKLYRALPKSE